MVPHLARAAHWRAVVIINPYFDSGDRDEEEEEEVKDEAAVLQKMMKKKVGNWIIEENERKNKYW